jgi:hypothetical protein
MLYEDFPIFCGVAVAIDGEKIVVERIFYVMESQFFPTFPSLAKCLLVLCLVLPAPLGALLLPLPAATPSYEGPINSTGGLSHSA